MPNWCENNLTIEGNEKDLKELIKKYTSIAHPRNSMFPEERCIDFNLISPTPKELLECEAPNPNKEQTAYFKKKYKTEDWYNWNNKNWGTKWTTIGVNFEKSQNEIDIAFQTAWCPPNPIIKKLSKLFPKLTFTLKYAEGGCCFAGEDTYKNNKKTSSIYTEDINHKIFEDMGFGPELEE